MKRAEVYDALERALVIPVFYNGDSDTALEVVSACYRGGIRAFEFANRGPKALEVFKVLAAEVPGRCPGMLLGVGSVSDAKSAVQFIRAGAAFVVGPQFVPAVCRICRFFGVAYIPGCGTVSEVGRAQRAGCMVCKAFPGDVLGPAFVKGLMAPMPWSRIMVTGGVKPEKANLEAWFKAGAKCVGMGSNLFPKDAVAARDWSEIEHLCAESVELARSLKK